MAATTMMGHRIPYKKVLYLQQDYPDNYVDSTFLKDLQRNVNVHPASLSLLLSQTLPITQHLSSTFLFLSCFIHLQRGSLDPITLLAGCGVLCAVGSGWSYYVGGISIGGGGGGSGAPSTGGTASPPGLPIIPLFTLYLLSPVLKTLTKATTSDSIWALSGTLLAVNLFLGDYRSIPSVGDAPRNPSSQLPSTLSLTAALSASTVLASRLSSNLAVFSLLLFSTLWFGPFPLLRSALTLKPTIGLTFFLAISAIWSLKDLGGGAAPSKIAALMLAGLALPVPLWRVWLSGYKDQVRGPWDLREIIT